MGTGPTSATNVPCAGAALFGLTVNNHTCPNATLTTAFARCSRSAAARPGTMARFAAQQIHLGIRV